MLNRRRDAPKLAGTEGAGSFLRMKTRLLFLAVLMFGGLSLSAQPAKPVAPVQPADKAAVEPKIAGVTVQRSNGTYLGVSLENGSFKLSFYDAKKKPALPDVPRAAARWNPSQKVGSDRIILNPSADGKALVGNKPVRPPYVFKLYLTLLKGEESSDGAAPTQAVETYTIDFRA